MNFKHVSPRKDFSKVSDRVPLTRTALRRVRLRALRRGVWFRFLSRVERGLMDLAVKVVDTVRSPVLATSLMHVVEKLLRAMEGEVARLMRTVGRPLAQKLSGIAQKWGNKSAAAWSRDLRFVGFLAVMNRAAFKATKETGE